MEEITNTMDEMLEIFCRKVLSELKKRVKGEVTIVDYEDNARGVRVDIVHHGIVFSYVERNIVRYIRDGGSSGAFVGKVFGKYRAFIMNRFFINGAGQTYKKPYKKDRRYEDGQ